jgi:tRNA threonylcarbamoyl adenosine modification protein YeaZ
VLALALDTSHLRASFAVFQGKECLGELFLETTYKNSLSAQLASQISQFFFLNRLNIKSLNKLIVNRGPGSFTGLRSGMAFMQGLSLAGDIPLYSVTSFEALNASTSENSFNKKIVYLLDTKCNSFYTSFLTPSGWHSQIVLLHDLKAFLSCFSCVISDQSKPELLEIDESFEWIQKETSAQLIYSFFSKTQDKKRLLREDLFYLKEPLT